MKSQIPIAEIFGPTLQGEGPNAGARCLFIRVKKCDFHCSWCDSSFTWHSDPYPATEYKPEELAYHINELVSKTNCKRVVLTGGNPCLYDFGPVIQNVSDDVNFDVETQGSLTPYWLSLIDTIVFSPKAPSSGMPDTYDKITEFIQNEMNSSQKVAIKIPVFDDDDINFARKYAQFVNEYIAKYSGDLRMYLSVGNSDVKETGQIRDRVLSDYEKLLDKINSYPEHFENVFILPQLHTLVWGNKQGV